MLCTQTMPVHFPSREAARLLGFAGSRPEATSKGSEADESSPAATDSSLARDCHSVEAGVVQGFQLAAAAGPLCDEPLWGLAFQV